MRKTNEIIKLMYKIIQKKTVKILWENEAYTFIRNKYAGWIFYIMNNTYSNISIYMFIAEYEIS